MSVVKDPIPQFRPHSLSSITLPQLTHLRPFHSVLPNNLPSPNFQRPVPVSSALELADVRLSYLLGFSICSPRTIPHRSSLAVPSLLELKDPRLQSWNLTKEFSTARESTVPDLRHQRPIYEPAPQCTISSPWRRVSIPINSHLERISMDRFSSSSKAIPIHMAEPPSSQSLYRMQPTRSIMSDRGGSVLDPRMDPDSFQDLIWQSIGDNAIAMVANKVIPSSQATYATGWRRWHTYTALIDTDLLMQRVPPGFVRLRLSNSNLGQFDFRILTCIGYLAYLINHPTKFVTATSAIKYLTGVRYYLTRNGLDTSFMDGSAFLKAARAGADRAFRMTPGNSIADHQTLPVCLGMLEISCREELDLTTLNGLALFTALYFAYTFLCRISEYIERPKSDHHIRSASVVFRIAHEFDHQISEDRPYRLIPSDQVWQFHKSTLLGVNVTIKDSKNDPFGIGRKNPWVRFLGPRPSWMAYDISEILYDFAVRARPLRLGAFFATTLPQGLRISADIMNSFLQEKLAVRFGLNPSRIHSHSLRFAGASALRASGKVDDSTIMINARLHQT